MYDIDSNRCPKTFQFVEMDGVFIGVKWKVNSCKMMLFDCEKWFSTSFEYESTKSFLFLWQLLNLQISKLLAGRVYNREYGGYNENYAKMLFLWKAK